MNRQIQVINRHPLPHLYLQPPKDHSTEESKDMNESIENTEERNQRYLEMFEDAFGEIEDIEDEHGPLKESASTSAQAETLATPLSPLPMKKCYDIRAKIQRGILEWDDVLPKEKQEEIKKVTNHIRGTLNPKESFEQHKQYDKWDFPKKIRDDNAKQEPDAEEVEPLTDSQLKQIKKWDDETKALTKCRPHRNGIQQKVDPRVARRRNRSSEGIKIKQLKEQAARYEKQEAPNLMNTLFSADVIREQFQKDAHRIIGVLTIRANKKKEGITNEEAKSYLKGKLKTLYECLSSLNNQKFDDEGKRIKNPAFSTIPHEQCAKFDAFFESRCPKGKPVAPHYHVLIYDEHEALTDWKRLSQLFLKLSGKECGDFKLPTIHITMLGNNYERTLEENRKECVNYFTKFFGEDDDADELIWGKFTSPCPHYSHKEFEKESVLDPRELKKMRLTRKKEKKKDKKWLDANAAHRETKEN